MLHQLATTGDRIPYAKCKFYAASYKERFELLVAAH